MTSVVVTAETVHPRALEEICRSVRRELRADVTLVHRARRDVQDLMAAVPEVDSLVLCPAPGPDLSEVLGTAWPRPGRTVRVDFGSRDLDASSGLAAHIRGRGVDGLLWALRSAVHHDRHPFVRAAYGPHEEQFGELLLPQDGDEPFPVVVLIHGGYWHDRWQLDLMDGLATDCREHGFAAWNIEYRRPESHGWTATRDDVHAAIRHLGKLAGGRPLDANRVVVAGHSAGGQLAVRVCADLSAEQHPAGLAGCVSLAGVMDLVEAARRELGERAASIALGTGPDERPDEYRAGSPIHRIPIGVPTAVVTAADDSRDLNEMSWRYVEAARAAGDPVEHLHGSGGHFTLIDPASEIWARTREAITAMVATNR